MSTLRFENWDTDCTPPAPPTGWNFDSHITTSAGTSPNSSPNLIGITAGAGGFYAATWQTPDTNGGNVAVLGTVRLGVSGSILGCNVSIFFRSNSSTTSYSSSTFYEAVLSGDGGGELDFNKNVAGISSTIASVGITGLASGAWYDVTASAVGSSITITVQRVSDGFWLNSSGTFASSAATAIATTDSSITGAGYAGYGIASTGSTAVQADDWLFSTPGDVLLAAAGSYSISGKTGSFQYGRIETGVAGSYGITGHTATLVPNAPLAGSLGTYSITGDAATFLRTHVEVGAAGAYTITGKTASIGGAAFIVGAAGVYLISGQAAGLIDAHKLPGVEGAYAITGLPASLFEPFTIPAAAGIYSISGDTSPLAWGHDLVGVAGTYAITGHDGIIFPSGIPLPAQGSYLISRTPAGLFADRILVGTTGTYAITGIPATLFQPFTVPASAGIYTITGDPAAFGRQITQTATPGVYTITGLPAGLIVANADGTPGPVAYHVYANSGVGDPIDYDAPIDTTSGLTYTTAPLAFPGTWSFGVRAFYVDSMLEERNLDCYVTIILDASGHDITSRPAPPSSLRAFPLAQGAIRAEWYYPPPTGLKAPTGFHVYTAIGVLSYSTPTATVLYNTGIQNSFVANMPGFMDGVTYTIGVRAYNATAEETNTTTVTVTAIGVGPSAVESLVGIATAQG